MATKEGTLAEIASADIVIFVSRSCPYCQTAMKDLKNAGFAASILDPSPSQRTILKEMTGSSSVPNCWVKGKYVGGCNDGPESWMGIAKMIKSGKLAELLA